MLAIRRLVGADLPAATAIVRSLPDHFTSDVPGLIERDAAAHDGWVLTDAGAVAGFAIARRRPPGNPAAIYVAALRPTR
jgi:hypothetical protein